jgi:hypothetical protein
MRAVLWLRQRKSLINLNRSDVGWDAAWEFYSADKQAVQSYRSAGAYYIIVAFLLVIGLAVNRWRPADLSSQGMGSLSAASQAYLVAGGHGVEPLLSEIPEKELCIVALVAAHPQFLAIQQDYLVMAMKPWMNLLHLGNVHER